MTATSRARHGTAGRALGLAAATVAAVQAAPAVTAIGPLRRRVLPRLSGAGPTAHIALTLDDGPAPTSTPAFLDLLARHERRATFFVLGAQAVNHPHLVRRMVDEGHEVAVHGWTHHCTLARPPGLLVGELRWACDTVEDLTGGTVAWYRPPFGVLSTEALLACSTLGLTPVLWTAWGREWERSATPTRIVKSVLATLQDGGTILLHDTDLHSPYGDWRRTLEATDTLLSTRLQNARVGPLRDHWPAPP
jgi:peptidoglycan/xylan/chitin deacetylase (PgdA/CDA1 family)